MIKEVLHDELSALSRKWQVLKDFYAVRKLGRRSREIVGEIVLIRCATFIAVNNSVNKTNC